MKTICTACGLIAGAGGLGLLVAPALIGGPLTGPGNSAGPVAVNPTPWHNFAPFGGGGALAGGESCAFLNGEPLSAQPSSQKDTTYPFWSEGADDFVLTDSDDPDGLNPCVLDQVEFAASHSGVTLPPYPVKITIYEDVADVCNDQDVDFACSLQSGKGPGGFPLDATGGVREHLPCCAEPRISPTVCELKVPVEKTEIESIGGADFIIRAINLKQFDCVLEKNRKYWCAPSPVFPFGGGGGQAFLYTSTSMNGHEGQQIFLFLGLPWASASMQVWPGTDLFLNIFANKVGGDPTGACCFNDGGCAELTEKDCSAGGGSYQGDNTNCDDVDCAPPGDCSDFPCGNNKVLLCHVPPGNPDNPHTICINEHAVPAHLANHKNDHCGPCEEGVGDPR